MGDDLTITLLSSPRKVTITTTRKAPVGDLQGVWDVSTDSEKNTFVDANDTEILTFIDDVLIQLSTDATAAINNITGGAGTLTDIEKYWISRLVDGIGTTIWAKMDYWLSAGFDDEVAALTDYIGGVLATNSGGTLDGKTWELDFLDFIETNFAENGGSNFLRDDACFGSYVVKNQMELTGEDNTGFRAGSKNSIFNLPTGPNLTYRINGASQALVTATGTFLDNGLYTVNRSGASAEEFYKNGIEIDNNVRVSDTAPTTTTFRLTLPGKSGLLFVGGSLSAAEQLTIYSEFENFRTGLLLDKGTPEILYNIPQKTGQVTSSRDGDDVWIEDNYLDHFREAQSFWNGIRPELIAGSFTILTQNNAFGNTNRYTDDLGGQIYTADLLLDHLTGNMYHILPDVPVAWNAGIDNSLGTLFGGSQAEGGFTNWMFLNMNYAKTIVQPLSSVLNYSPFNGLTNFVSTNNVGTATTSPTTTNGLYFASSMQTGMRAIAKTSTFDHLIIVRKHY